MSDDCPVCERPALGSQIVELPHPSTDGVTHAISCSGCGAVYRSADAAEQVGDGPDTVTLDADHAHRLFAVFDHVVKGDAFVTYGADYKARDHLRQRLIEEGVMGGEGYRR